MSDQRNWLEQLMDKIPGYSGYVDRERRRDIDKLHREHLADRLRRLKEPLTGVVKELTDNRRLFEVGPVESALKKLDKIENRVRFASYGYAGFFDVVKIEQAQLDAIYRFDLALVEQVEKLETEIQELKSKAGSTEGIKAGSQEVQAALDEIDRSFEDRYNAINGFATGQPPGRPLFSQ